MRQRPLTGERFVAAVNALDLGEEVVTPVIAANTLQQAEERWSKSLLRIKSVWRRLVMELHPDRNPGVDPSRFHKVQEAWETMQHPDVPRLLVAIGQHLRVQPALQPRVRVHVYGMPFQSTSTSATTTSTAAYGGFSDGDPFFIRRM